jgi:HEAT repeat protein
MLGDVHLDWHSKLEIVDALAAQGERAYLPLLAAFTETPDNQSRGLVALALGRLGDQRAIDPLLSALGGTGYIADDVGEALGRFGDAVFPQLMTRFRTGAANVRQDTALALGYLGDSRALDPLIEALHDQDDGVRWYSTRALGLLNNLQAVEPLLAALNTATLEFDEEVQCAAIEALGKLGDRRATQALIGGLSNPGPSTIWVACATALGALRATEAIPYLIPKLADTDKYEPVAWDVAMALGRIGDPAIEPLLTALEYGDSDIRVGVIWALGCFDNERVIHALMQMRNDINRSAAGRQVAEMASAALERIEDRANM